MKKVTYTCDRCGEEIEGVLYELECWAEDLEPGPYGGSFAEAVQQNMSQNLARQRYTRHLCARCKDTLTDGLFIV